MKTERVTTSQALVRFLAEQHVERDGEVTPFFGGVLGIFGHGNLAGLGQALLQYQDRIRYYQGRNEQAMVHIASGYAKMKNRLATLACTTSIGPGATNMVTGAALATVNRLPVLLLPGDIFAKRLAGPLLQQLEHPLSQDISVNDAFIPVSRYWDRINRPDQLTNALFAAMRVLTSPADTGAVTLALPQDVQAEAWDFPAELFLPRIWQIPRNRPDAQAIARAVTAVRRSQRPLIIAGGGVIYSGAAAELRRFVEITGIPVGETQSGKGALPFDHPQCLGAIGVSGSAHANRIARDADLVIGIGTRYTDFTTASKTLFGDTVGFVNINVAEMDSTKHAAIALTGDARETLRLLQDQLSGWAVEREYRQIGESAAVRWRADVEEAISPGLGTRPTQAEVIGIVNDAADARAVVVGAAGSLPGDLHRLWRTRDTKGYQVEYGYSCMGYEIAGALGAKLADPSREVISMVGDGSWLMMAQEVLTSIQEDAKLIIVLVDNHGYGSIAALSESLGSQGFGTRFRFRGADGQLSGDDLPIDLVASARSLGAEVLTAGSGAELKAALHRSKETARTTVIYVEVDPRGTFGGSGAWWDVPVAEVSSLRSTEEARREYEVAVAKQRHYLAQSGPERASASTSDGGTPQALRLGLAPK